MRVEISTVPATQHVLLIADSESNHIIGRCEMNLDGSLAMFGDMHIPIERIPERLPVRHTNQLALILGIRGFVNITIVDFERGYDEDIIRHKMPGKGLYVPNRYMVVTPGTGQEDRSSLALAPETIEAQFEGEPIRLPTAESDVVIEHSIEPPIASQSKVESHVQEDEHENPPAEVKKEAESSAPLAVETTSKPVTEEFDEWADDDVPAALKPSTGHAKSSSTEPSDNEE